MRENDILNQKPSDVNESQWRAINFEGKNLLIVAGPGTGKTHTITYRIIKIFERLQDGENILAITFTNKSAEEMKSRLEKHNLATDKIFVGTFHGFCLNLLMTYYSVINLPQDFKVIEPEKLLELTKDLWPNLSKAKRKDSLETISKLKALDQVELYTPRIEQLDTFLRRKGLLDFDSLLVEAVNLLEKNPLTQREIQKKYKYIFVDEYQDINPVQNALLRLLASDDSIITAIGDPNQAIYGFRGSDVRYFESFKDDFKNVSILSLSDNYRSTRNLIKASSQVIAQGNFYVPELTVNILKEGKLIIHESSTEKAEAEYVVHTIEKLVGGTSMFSHDSKRVEKHLDNNFSFGDIAVLYRLNIQRKVLEMALERSGIPYQTSGAESHYSEFGIEINAEKVNLLTMHAAKGLEFSVVFIIGCEENILPLNLAELKGDMEEERRLFYVAMTRAKEFLYLTSAKKRMIFGKTYQYKPSIFISAIEEKLKEIEQYKIFPKKKSSQEAQLKLFS